MLEPAAYFALFVGARRQWLSELAHQREERDSVRAEEDATEKRITELYTKAVDQLGSEKAAVRLGGLYSLERVAQSNPAHRQTIVNVICAYLRMPVDIPKPAKGSSVPSQLMAAERRSQLANERYSGIQVRLVAQSILRKHLAFEPDIPESHDDLEIDNHWPNMDIDLSGASLLGFSLVFAQVREALFVETQFHGGVELHGSTFTLRAFFSSAVVRGSALIVACEFPGVAWFDSTLFEGETYFEGTEFEAFTTFENATFSSVAKFEDVMFKGETVWAGTVFNGETDLSESNFADGQIPSRSARVPEATS